MKTLLILSLALLVGSCAAFPGYFHEASSAALSPYDVVSSEPPAPKDLNPNISPELDKVILRTLAKHPSDRFENCSAFASEFAAAISGLSREGVRRGFAQGGAPVEADMTAPAMTASGSFPLGGMRMSPSWRSVFRSSDSPGLPATIAGPLSPPVRNPSRWSSRRPPRSFDFAAASAEWHG